jgi:hypothetical protein
VGGLLPQHKHPLPLTYQHLFTPNIDVNDSAHRWHGTNEWSAHERKAIALGVRATIVALGASRDLTVLEIDFTNPPTRPHHCPPKQRWCTNPTTTAPNLLVY